MADPYAWTPTPEHLERSNVARFMRSHGIDDYSTLVCRSVEDIGWFWDAVVRELPIEFFHPYRRVFDDSRGIAQTRWFVDGTLNLAHNCVDRHARGPHPDRLAIIWEGEDGSVRRLSYEDLSREVDGLARGLRRLGVVKGDRIGLFLPMMPEAIAAFMACAKIGAIAIPIFSGHGVQAVSTRLADAEAKVLVTVDGFLRRGHAVEAKAVADEAADLCPSVRHTIVVRRLGDRPMRPGRDVAWEEVVASGTGPIPAEPMDAEDPFLIIYTSGTTGRPKGAVHVHGGFLVKIAQEVAHQADVRADDILHWVTDLGWIMGPWQIVGGLALGATLFLAEGAPDYPGPDRLWDLAERHGVTVLGVSPTLTRSLMRHGEDPVRKHDLSRLRILGSTGEPWNPDPWLWLFREVGGGRCPIINFTGGTEVGACFLSAFPITPLKPCALVGPSLGMDVDVFDAEGNPMVGGVGELVCKRPWPAMTRGFWKDEGRFLQTYWSRWPDVWVHGDWASIDADGDWFLHGRSDDTIKVAGKRIGPAEFESVLVGHPAVAEAATIGVPHELKGEVAWCYAVLRPGVAPSEELRRELCDRVAEALGKAFLPDRIRFAAELPKTRSAKILRRAVRARALGEDPGDLSSLDNPHALDAIDRAS